MPQSKPQKSSTYERMEFAYVSEWPIVPRNPGEPFPPYPERNISHWQTRDVPIDIANLCRELCRRGKHGVHIRAIGSLDHLAEMDLLGLPYKLTDWDKQYVWSKKLWVIPNAVFRFSEDGVSQQER